MDYRLDRQSLLDVLAQWNRFLRRKVRLIACGGTALTLQGVKPSTKDVDFMVPVLAEHAYLVGLLKNLGYEQVTASGWLRKGEIFRFDLFPGKRIHTTELMASPLEPENHSLLIEYSRLYIGILNPYDLIASKLIRGTGVDFEDCLMLAKALHGKLDITRLASHYRELISYNISAERVGAHIDRFTELLREEKLYE